MSRTPSMMLTLGTPAPDFSLPEPATGNNYQLSDFSGKPLVVLFICNHCPFVIHIAKQLAKSADDYMVKGVSVVAINSNDAQNYPDDSPKKMPAAAEAYGFQFPYLYDESQQVAKAYQAACTPDLYLFDSDHRLVYRGQFDSARPGNDQPVTGEELTAAVEALLEGRAITSEQRPSLGCNIKWRAGNEPDYFG